MRLTYAENALLSALGGWVRQLAVPVCGCGEHAQDPFDEGWVYIAGKGWLCAACYAAKEDAHGTH